MTHITNFLERHALCFDTAYDLVRAGWMAAARSPKTSTVALNCLIMCDGLVTALTGAKVVYTLREKDQDADRFYTDIALKAILLLAGVALFVKGSNHFLTPRIDLNEVLKQTNIPAGTFTATWKRPWPDELLRGLFVTRAVLNLFLAYLSSERLPLFNILVQGASFGMMSQAQWIQMTRVYPDPFKTFSGSTVWLKDNLQNSIDQLRATFYLKVSSPSTSDLKDKMQVIYDYSTQMFDNRFWMRSWGFDKKLDDFIPYSWRSSAPSNFQAWWTTRSGVDPMLQITASPRLGKRPPPSPDILSHLKAHVFHSGERWIGFTGIKIHWLDWRKLPQFFVPGHMIKSAAWERVQQFPLK